MLSFNADGPVKVPESDLVHYQEHPFHDFEHCYYFWINGNNPYGIRILCLRDLLRQWHTSQDISLISSTQNSPYACHDYGIDFTTILDVEGSNGRHFYWNLKNRPELFQEITSEWLYILQQDYLPLNAETYQYRDQLITALLSASNEDDENVRKLWSFHSLNQPITFAYDPLSVRLELLATNQKTLPTWLRAELWSWLDLYVKQRSKQAFTGADPSSPINLSADHTNYYGFQPLLNFLRAMVDDMNPAMIANLIRLLEAHLPDHVTYLSTTLLLKCTSTRCQIDKTSLVSCLHRHLLALDIKKQGRSFATSSGHHFLYWARGVLSHANPADLVPIEKIDQLLNIEPATLNLPIGA